MTMTKGEIINDANAFRDQIGLVDGDVLKLKDHIRESIGFQNPDSDGGEAIANVMLAHRHLEDARMRLGKCIQALEGGVSILDDPEVKALIATKRAGA